MEKTMNNTEMKKTQVFNVIILDRSGSMECIRQAAVEGFNETLPIVARVPSSLYAKLRELRMESFMATSTESWLAPI